MNNFLLLFVVCLIMLLIGTAIGSVMKAGPVSPHVLDGYCPASTLAC